MLDVLRNLGFKFNRGDSTLWSEFHYAGYTCKVSFVFYWHTWPSVVIVGYGTYVCPANNCTHEFMLTDHSDLEYLKEVMDNRKLCFEEVDLCLMS